MPDCNLLQSIDQKCGTTNNITVLSIFSSSSSGVFMLFTIPLNALIVYSLINERKKTYRSLFFKLLLNIALADLLTGLIADPASMNALTKEALRIDMSLFEVYIIHLSLFFTDAVALLTLTILSIERFIALVFPLRHFNGIQKRTENILVFSVWPISIILVLPYFHLKFIRQLVVFSSLNIVVTVLALVVTTITYKQKLGSQRFMQKLRASSDDQYKRSAIPQTTETVVNPNRLRNKKKVTRMFIVMLLVFVLTYLPTAVTMVYMNACTECNCVVVHVMRDVSILSILSSSVFRPLNFILTLKHLRISVARIFKKNNKVAAD